MELTPYKSRTELRGRNHIKKVEEIAIHKLIEKYGNDVQVNKPDYDYYVVKINRITYPAKLDLKGATLQVKWSKGK